MLSHTLVAFLDSANGVCFVFSLQQPVITSRMSSSTFDQREVVAILGARILGREDLVDITLRDGLIRSISSVSARQCLPSDQKGIVIDAAGRVVTCGFVDLHMHLDKAYMGGEEKWDCVTLQDMIEATAECRRTHWEETEIFSRALRGVELAVCKGTTSLRTHADLNLSTGLEGVKALVKLKKAVQSVVDMQVVAFLSEGFDSVSDGGEALLRQAMQLGADVVGGIAFDKQPGPFFDMLFKVAAEFQCDVDVHIDESNSASCPPLVKLYAEKAVKHHWQQRVAASHVCSLYWVSDDTAERVIQEMQQAQMAVITNPLTNLYIRGPNPRLPTGPTRLQQLLRSGIAVAVGTDNTHDFFSPLGNADMLLAGLMLAYQRRLEQRPLCPYILRLISEENARFFFASTQRTGLKEQHCSSSHAVNVGLREGCKGDLVVLGSSSPDSCLMDLAARDYVIKNGRIIVESGRLLVSLNAPSEESQATSA